MVLKSLPGSPIGMLEVIILLKDNVIWSFVIKIQSLLQLLLQNLDIKLSIHPTINLACHSNLFSSNTAPHHDRSSFKLHSSLHQPTIIPCPSPTIRPNVIDFGLI